VANEGRISLGKQRRVGGRTGRKGAVRV